MSELASHAGRRVYTPHLISLLMPNAYVDRSGRPSGLESGGTG